MRVCRDTEYKGLQLSLDQVTSSSKPSSFSYPGPTTAGLAEGRRATKTPRSSRAKTKPRLSPYTQVSLRRHGASFGATYPTLVVGKRWWEGVGVYLWFKFYYLYSRHNHYLKSKEKAHMPDGSFISINGSNRGRKSKLEYRDMNIRFNHISL